MVGGRRPAHQPRNNNRYSTKNQVMDPVHHLERKCITLHTPNLSTLNRSQFDQHIIWLGAHYISYPRIGTVYVMDLM
jgi:hypothetical protein